MTKRESNILKCLAIMLMLAHHLFMYADQSGFPELVYGPLLNTPERLAAFGQLCKLCVTIFVFVTAYGTAMSYRGDSMGDDRELICLSTRRWVKLLLSFNWCISSPLLSVPWVAKAGSRSIAPAVWRTFSLPWWISWA